MDLLRTLQGSLLAVALTGCVSFVPSYDEALLKDFTTISTEIQKIEAAVNSVYGAPVPFEKVEPQYVAAYAAAADAEGILAGQQRYYSGQMAEGAVAAMKAVLDLCKANLDDQLAFHRRNNLRREDLEGFDTVGPCSLGAFLAARQRGK